MEHLRELTNPDAPREYDLSAGVRHLAEEQGEAIGHRAAEEIMSSSQDNQPGMAQKATDSATHALDLAKDVAAQLSDSVRGKAAETSDTIRDRGDAPQSGGAAGVGSHVDSATQEAQEMAAGATQKASDMASTAADRINKGREQADAGISSEGLDAATGQSARTEDTIIP